MTLTVDLFTHVLDEKWVHEGGVPYMYLHIRVCVCTVQNLCIYIYIYVAEAFRTYSTNRSYNIV